MKIPRWLRWRSREKASVTKSDNLKKMRQQTDQRLKQQVAQKEQRQEIEKRNEMMMTELRQPYAKNC
jgi:hypothetical protein